MQEIMTFLGNHPLLVSIAGLCLILLLTIELSRQRFNKFSLSPFQLTQYINHENAVVIDIRPTESYQKGHIIDAINIPVKDELDSKKLDKYKKRPAIIVCQNGTASRKIAAQLKNQGYNSFSLAGGIQAWVDADMPLVKG